MAWRWDKFHHNAYPNMPWSRTPFKFLFDREVPTFGSTNTPHVSKVSYQKALKADGKFESTHVAGLKMIVAHDAAGAKQATNLFSCDTGIDGSIFSRHYFDMNESHLKGNLFEMLIGDQIQKVKHDVLMIKPTKNNRKAKQEDL
jgi:acyl-homoserine lactone acylase PvdQ